MKQSSIPIAPVSVTQWVQDRLRGFAVRQAARAAKRKQNRARAGRPEEEKVRRIGGMKVIFRGEFQGLKRLGRLNRIGAKLSDVLMTVDVYRSGAFWYARHEKQRLKLPGETTHGSAKDAIENAFEKKLSPWVLLNAQDELPIDPDYVEETPEGKFTMREVTHCGSRRPEDSAPSPKGPNFFRAACGEEVHASLIKSYRGKHPPLCKECRMEWEKTPAEERFKE